jgi:hypothetical protein
MVPLVCARYYCTAIKVATGLLVGVMIVSYWLSKQVVPWKRFGGICLEYRSI